MMDGNFQIEVIHKGQQVIFMANLVQYGYSYRIDVDVEGEIISFEPDEERNLRARLDWNSIDKKKTINIDLLKTIAGELTRLLL